MSWQAHRRAWNIAPYCGLRKTKQRRAVRANARGMSEAGDVTSCCAPAKDEAEIGGRVARRRAARPHAWFHHRRGICIANEWRARPTRPRSLSVALRWLGASVNTAEEARLVVDWRGSRSCGCERSLEAIRGAGSGEGTHRPARAMTRLRLPCAESRHRKVTLPSARASNRWLEMATR